MLRSLHFILIFFTAGTCWAQRMPVLTDSTITRSAEIMKRFQENSMVDIKSKYNDLLTNFIPHFLTVGIDLDCRSKPGISLNSYASFMGIRIDNKSRNLPNGGVETQTTVTHTDCLGKVILVERIRSIGVLPAPLSIADAVKFNRKFEVDQGEVFRDYNLEINGETTLATITSRLITQQGMDQILNTIEFMGKTWLEITQHDPSSLERRVEILQFPLNFRYLNLTAQVNTTDNKPISVKLIWNDRRMEYLVADKTTSQLEFDKKIDELVVGISTIILKYMFSEVINKMPATEKSKVGVTDSPFLRELQVNYQRLQTNSEIEQIKSFFLKTIEDIKTGKLKVE